MAGTTFFCISLTVTVQSTVSPLSSAFMPGRSKENDFVSPTFMPMRCFSKSSGMRPMPVRYVRPSVDRLSIFSPFWKASSASRKPSPFATGCGSSDTNSA